MKMNEKRGSRAKGKTFAVINPISIAALVLGITPLVLATPVHAKPEVNKMCAVTEQGFSAVQTQPGDKPVVSVGVEVRNRTKKDAVQVTLRVNAFSQSGKLMMTQELGLQNVPSRSTVVDGYTFETEEPVGRISVSATCDERSKFGGTKPLPKYTSTAATYDPAREPTVQGEFVNRRKTAYFYNVFYVLRNVTGNIVGGSFSNTLGDVAKGDRIAWKAGGRALITDGPLTVQANTSSVYSAF